MERRCSAGVAYRNRAEPVEVLAVRALKPHLHGPVVGGLGREFVAVFPAEDGLGDRENLSRAHEAVARGGDARSTVISR